MSKTVGANTNDCVWSNSGSLPLVLYDESFCVYGLGLIAHTHRGAVTITSTRDRVHS